ILCSVCWGAGVSRILVDVSSAYQLQVAFLIHGKAVVLPLKAQVQRRSLSISKLHRLATCFVIARQQVRLELHAWLLEWLVGGTHAAMRQRSYPVEMCRASGVMRLC